MNITNQSVSEYLDQKYRPLTPDFWHIRQDAEKRHIPIITRDTESLLSVLLRPPGPSRILEIGTAIGYSAAYMAAICPDARIDTIENNPKMLAAAETNVSILGFGDRVQLIAGDGIAVLESRRETCGPEDGYDFIFVDAAKSSYRKFFDLALPLLKTRGIILCDNVLMRGTVADDKYDPEGKHKTSIRNMRDFLEHILSHDAVQTILLPVGDGVSISQWKNK